MPSAFTCILVVLVSLSTLLVRRECCLDKPDHLLGEELSRERARIS